MTKLRWVEIFKNNTAANLFLMMSMEVWSMTATWSQGWAVLEKAFLALVCAGRISFWVFISFKCLAGSSGLVLWIHVLSVSGIQMQLILPWSASWILSQDSFLWVHEIYVAIKEINQSDVDCCTSFCLKIFEVLHLSQSKTTTWDIIWDTQHHVKTSLQPEVALLLLY